MTGFAAGPARAGIKEEAEMAAGPCLMTGLKGRGISKSERDFLASRQAAGVILFQRNLESFRQIYELCRELKSLSPRPLLLGIDMEGGAVNRLSHIEGALPWPSARALGEKAPHQIFALAKALGRRLAALGFDINFAPVADLPIRESALLKTRAFGKSPESVSRAAAAFARGTLAGGLLPCLKHFPGHGGAVEDSHKVLPKDMRSVGEMAPQLRVFREILKSRAFPVMTAHVEFPLIEKGAPATFSQTLLRGLLREKWGFEGLIVSDDIDMGALGEWTPGERVFYALRGGCELILCCQREETAHEAIEFFERLRGGQAKQAMSLLAAASQKISRLRDQRRAAAPPKSWRAAAAALSRPEHEGIFRSLGLFSQ